MNTPRSLLLVVLSAGLVACHAAPRDDATALFVSSSKLGAGNVSAPASKMVRSGPALLQAGRSVSGDLDAADQHLSNGSYAELHAYAGRAGELIHVTMDSSDVDSFVLVLRSDDDGDLSPIAMDDDSGGELNARVSVELPADATYYIAANTAVADQLGAYTVSVSSEGSMRFPSGDRRDGRFALLVGAGDYPQGDGNDLEAVAEDLRVMKATLIDRYGFAENDIVVLQDARATRLGIARGFREHLSRAGEDGVALFFYSGHGMRVGDNVGPSGASDREADNEDDALYLADAGLLLDDELAVLIEELEADRRLIVIDSCFSGTVTMAAGEARAKEVLADEVECFVSYPTDGLSKSAEAWRARVAGDRDLQPRNHVLIASSREVEVSWCAPAGDYTAAPVSIFSFTLARAMQASDDAATFGSLMESATEWMGPWLADAGAEQSPQLRGTRSGESVAAYLKTPR